MGRCVLLIMVCVGTAFANEEITVELPGGATMEMVWVEPGTFVMGTTPWSGEDYVVANPDHPAVYISWDDMQAFAHHLNEAVDEELYRLPTEAEWEYACRAGTTTQWSFGGDWTQQGEYGWYGGNAMDLGLDYGQPVGAKLPNPWGLYDMHGNVFEFCQDWFDSYTSDNQTDPTGPATAPGSAAFEFTGPNRVMRGGDFAFARYLRSALRYPCFPSQGGVGVGARLLRTGPQIPTAVTPQTWGQLKKAR